MCTYDNFDDSIIHILMTTKNLQSSSIDYQALKNFTLKGSREI